MRLAECEAEGEGSTGGTGREDWATGSCAWREAGPGPSLLPAPSLGEMDCVLFIALSPCVSSIMNPCFSACDSSLVSDGRTLLRVPEGKRTQSPATHQAGPRPRMSSHGQVAQVPVPATGGPDPPGERGLSRQHCRLVPMQGSDVTS